MGKGAIFRTKTEQDGMSWREGEIEVDWPNWNILEDTSIFH